MLRPTIGRYRVMHIRLEVFSGRGATARGPKDARLRPQELEDLLVRLTAREELEQLGHRLLGVKPRQAAAQQMKTRHDLRGVELLLLAGAALGDVDGGIDSPLGEL